MSSVDPFSTNSDAIYAARLTSASAASSSKSGSAASTIGKTAPEAAPEDSVSLSHAGARELFQLGRVSYQEQAGHLTSAQGSQLDSLIQQLQTAVQSDAQANGGSLTSSQAQDINQLQTNLSHEIFADAHGLSNGSNQIVPPAVPAT